LTRSPAGSHASLEWATGASACVAIRTAAADGRIVLAGRVPA
jgi:hypothetical protein